MEFRHIAALNEVINFARLLDNYSKKFIFKDVITKMEFVYMRMVWQNPGITQLELSRLNSTTKPRVVTIITSLEKKGMIRKKEDGYRKQLHCTKQGRELTEKILLEQDEVVEKIFEGYSDEEIQEFFSTVKTVNSKLAVLGEEKDSIDKQ